MFHFFLFFKQKYIQLLFPKEKKYLLFEILSFVAYSYLKTLMNVNFLDHINKKKYSNGRNNSVFSLRINNSLK